MHGRILAVLGGTDLGDDELIKWVNSADEIWAADSGADRLFRLGLPCHSVIGDMDSISKEAAQHYPNHHLDCDQESTDCDKLLARAHLLGVHRLTLINVEGDRMDHVLSTLNSAAGSPIQVQLALRGALGTIVFPGDHTFETEAKAIVSLIPLQPSSEVVFSGVAWPLDGQTLQLGQRISVSNVALSDSIRLGFKSGVCLLYRAFSSNNLPKWPS